MTTTIYHLSFPYYPRKLIMKMKKVQELVMMFAPLGALILLIIIPMINCEDASSSEDPAAAAADAPPSPPRLCMTQLALVNHACSTIPYVPLPPHPPSNDLPLAAAYSLHGHGDDQPSSSCRRRIHSRHHGGHRRQSRHDQHVEYQETPAERECCRWLNAVDNECVCDLLARLPVFLSGPLHNITVSVDQGCFVTYQCPGRRIVKV
ncbi:hypothetical protein Dimus_011014 [Dionaea muscipula]